MNNDKLPILSPYPDATNAFAKNYKQEIIPLHKPGTLIDYILDLDYYHLPWPQLLAHAESLYYFGKVATFPDIDGIFYITPDLDESWIIESNKWTQGSQSRIIINLCQPSISNSQLLQFIAPAEELNFIKNHNDHFLLSRNQSLCQQIRWSNQEFFRFSHWHLTERALYNNKLVNMNFLDKLDNIAPSYTDVIYNILCIIGSRQDSKYLGTILRKILEIIERPLIGTYLEGLITNKPILFCGLDTGGWPLPQSPHGKILKQLLTTKKSIVTQSISYNEPSKTHNWSYYCDKITKNYDLHQSCAHPFQPVNNIQPLPEISHLPLRLAINQLYNFIYDRKKFYLQTILNISKQSKSLYAIVQSILQKYEKLEDYEDGYIKYKSICGIVKKIQYQLNKFETGLKIHNITLDQKYTIQYKTLLIQYTVDRVYTHDDGLIYLQYKFGTKTHAGMLSWLQDIPVFTASQNKVQCVKAKSYEKEVDEYIRLTTK